MTDNRKDKLPTGIAAPQSLRLWPGIIIVALQWLIRYVIPQFVPGTVEIGMLAGPAGWLLVALWWAFFSRAPRLERWAVVILMIMTIIATPFILHESIATGFQGAMFAIIATPYISLAFVTWAVVSPRLSEGTRRLTMVATVLVVCSAWALLRSDGITGSGGVEFTWRWTESHEAILLALNTDEPMTSQPVHIPVDQDAEWPGFRGPLRDGIVRGSQISTDWFAAPPREIWRRPIGPGCSSFAVLGTVLYTQEQRGDAEVVTCYTMNTGEPVWRHADKARFWDSHAGAGPRSTPAVSSGRVYTMGATGILNALDAADGTLLWSRNAATDLDAKIPEWGLASSPLVLNDMVVAAVTGTMIAYDLITGDQRWIGPDGGKGYSSPHLLTIDGVDQILLMSETGATSLAPADGTLLWKHRWPKERIVQPTLIAEGELLISAGDGFGIRRIAVTHSSDGWTVEERWTSDELNPIFNDSVVHEGYAYGFDGLRLVCIDIADGQRQWKGDHNGGQILLLAEQGLLLVLTEMGELVLIKATPDEYTELTRLQAIEGKTWNHPVLVDDVLLIRNTQEMAAYRLSRVAG